MMEHPSVLAVHRARCSGSRSADLTDEPEQGLVEIAEVRRLRGPVVHLEVDIRGVFRVPRREHLIVPYTLQVGGLTAGLRRAYKEIAAEGEVCGTEPVVVGGAEGGETLVGGHRRMAVGTEEERCPREHRPVDGHMTAAGRGVVVGHGRAQLVLGARFLVGADVLIVHEVGGYGDVNRGLVGTRDGQDAVARRQLSALRRGRHAPHEAYFPLAALEF